MIECLVTISGLQCTEGVELRQLLSQLGQKQKNLVSQHHSQCPTKSGLYYQTDSIVCIVYVPDLYLYELYREYRNMQQVQHRS
jgi:hypothetical protein